MVGARGVGSLFDQPVSTRWTEPALPFADVVVGAVPNAAVPLVTSSALHPGVLAAIPTGPDVDDREDGCASAAGARRDRS